MARMKWIRRGKRNGSDVWCVTNGWQRAVSHSPLFPTLDAPITAIFTSESDDFFRLMPRDVISTSEEEPFLSFTTTNLEEEKKSNRKQRKSRIFSLCQCRRAVMNSLDPIRCSDIYFLMFARTASDAEYSLAHNFEDARTRSPTRIDSTDQQNFTKNSKSFLFITAECRNSVRL